MSGSSLPRVSFFCGDAFAILARLPDDHYAAAVTSPPYFGLLRYDGQRGLEVGGEDSVAEYVARLVEIFGQVRRVIRPDGVLWLTLGDTFNSYAGRCGPGSTAKFQARSRVTRLMTRQGLRDQRAKPKDLLGVPWRVALALRDDGWYLRGEIVWHKSNAAPEPAACDRPYRRHETIFLLAKSMRYGFRGQAGAYGSVWRIDNRDRSGWHPADFPPSLVRRFLELSPMGPTIDPFGGSGTVALESVVGGRDSTYIDTSESYTHRARTRVLSGTMFVRECGDDEKTAHSEE